jgi:hypothetical protein
MSEIPKSALSPPCLTAPSFVGGSMRGARKMIAADQPRTITVPDRRPTKRSRRDK